MCWLATSTYKKYTSAIVEPWPSLGMQIYTQITRCCFKFGMNTLIKYDLLHQEPVLLRNIHIEIHVG